MNNLGLLRKLVEGKELNFDEAKLLGEVPNNPNKFPFSYLTRGGDKEKVGGGSYGEIFKINNGKNLVVKKPHKKTALKSIINGFEIQKKVFEKGFNCAKPEGIYNFYNFSKKQWEEGFVMEYLVNSRKPENIRQEFLNKKIEEIKKRGFRISDSGNHNLLTYKGKLYFIDFDFWTYKKPKKEILKEFFEKIFYKTKKEDKNNKNEIQI